MGEAKHTCPHCGYDEADKAMWQRLCSEFREMRLTDQIGDAYGHYILDESRQPIQVCLLRWAQWFENIDNRRVAETTTDLFWISTVFLGINHRFGDRGPPICFESMVFTRDEHIQPLLKRMVRDDLDQVRYSSWDDAITGHEALVRRYQKREADALARLEKHLKRKHARSAR